MISFIPHFIWLDNLDMLRCFFLYYEDILESFCRIFVSMVFSKTSKESPFSKIDAPILLRYSEILICSSSERLSASRMALSMGLRISPIPILTFVHSRRFQSADFQDLHVCVCVNQHNIMHIRLDEGRPCELDEYSCELVQKNPICSLPLRKRYQPTPLHFLYEQQYLVHSEHLRQWYALCSHRIIYLYQI